jgi:hypothetical protein
MGFLQAFQKSLSASLPHQAKRLCDCRESRNLEGRARKVIKANHGNIAGTLETDVRERSQRSYRGEIVEAEDRSKVTSSRQELAHRVISELRGRGVTSSLRC